MSDVSAACRVSEATSRAIFDDAHSAYVRDDHPCHHFVVLQPDVPPDRWQMPEPFNGATATAGFVFLGGNPSYRAHLPVPTIADEFDEWDRFHRERFDTAPAGEWHPLYQAYQRIGELAVGDHFQLGVDAIVLESVRYRSKRGLGISTPVLRYERDFTRLLLRDLRPRAIVVVSGHGWRGTRLALDGLEGWNEPLGALEGRLLAGELDGQRIAVLPAIHPAGLYPRAEREREAAIQAVAAALKAFLHGALSPAIAPSPPPRRSRRSRAVLAAPDERYLFLERVRDEVFAELVGSRGSGKGDNRQLRVPGVAHLGVVWVRDRTLRVQLVDRTGRHCERWRELAASDGYGELPPDIGPVKVEPGARSPDIEYLRFVVRFTTADVALDQVRLCVDWLLRHGLPPDAQETPD